MKNNRIYRKVWEKTYGPIPKDKNGRSFEIHHIDGNCDNNDLSNLMLVTIEEHYEIHFQQGDYGACNKILLRMCQDPKELSKKISELNKLRTGDKNPFYGKKHSKKAIEKIRKANSVKKGSYSESHRKNISKGLLNYERTEEHNKKLKEAHNSEKYLKKIRKPIIAYGQKFNSIKAAKEVYGHSKIWGPLKDSNNKEVYYVY